VRLEDCRPFVRDLAVALEQTLRLNDERGKGEFYPLSLVELGALLSEEVRELHAEMRIFGRSDERIQAEALDVALVALFIWANFGGSLHVRDRGRASVF
jgi:NTP pyrophosphatase (non-canonical NTP hydrolase)